MQELPPRHAVAAQEALKFFDWAYKNGGQMASELDYVPLPASLVGLIRKTWGEIKGPDGKPLYASTM